MTNIQNIEKEVKVEIIKNIKKIKEDIDQDQDLIDQDLIKKIKKEKITRMNNLQYH